MVFFFRHCCDIDAICIWTIWIGVFGWSPQNALYCAVYLCYTRKKQNSFKITIVFMCHSSNLNIHYNVSKIFDEKRHSFFEAKSARIFGYSISGGVLPWRKINLRGCRKICLKIITKCLEHWKQVNLTSCQSIFANTAVNEQKFKENNTKQRHSSLNQLIQLNAIYIFNMKQILKHRWQNNGFSSEVINCDRNLEKHVMTETKQSKPGWNGKIR